MKTATNNSMWLNRMSAAPTTSLKFIDRNYSFCKKDTYIKKIDGSVVCFKCGNYHIFCQEEK